MHPHQLPTTLRRRRMHRFEPSSETTCAVSLSRCDGDRGQAVTLLLGVVAALLVILMVGLASMGSAAIDRTRAQSAADAAALASVVAGRSAADRLAQLHDGAVVSWSRGADGTEVTVTVRVGHATATARASNAA
ncbi:MAG: pilus assembly protein TadG-related protein [Ilumatobacter sp.]